MSLWSCIIRSCFCYNSSCSSQCSTAWDCMVCSRPFHNSYCTNLCVWCTFSSCIFVCILLALQIYKHLTNFYKPELQRYIIRILWLVPIYAIDSWFSLRFKNIALYLDTARETYEVLDLLQLATNRFPSSKSIWRWEKVRRKGIKKGESISS